jgi:hypothetical protein
VIFANLGRQLKVGVEESACQLGNQFLLGIAFIAPALAAEAAVKP